jgi:hypothetical protein
MRGSATQRIVICSIVSALRVVLMTGVMFAFSPMHIEGEYFWILVLGCLILLLGVAGLVIEYVRGWRSRDE